MLQDPAPADYYPAGVCSSRFLLDRPGEGGIAVVDSKVGKIVDKLQKLPMTAQVSR